MINTYDILINPKKFAYDFYEWDSEDEIKHIKKILCFKVNKKTIIDFAENDVRVEQEFLKKIENKTEVFGNRDIKKINYACILFCNLECMCFLFDNAGKTLGRSKLLFDEADDIISSGKNKTETIINYKVLSSLERKKNYTRKEIKDINRICDYINKLSVSNKEDELKYLYYECFKKEENFEQMVLELKQNLNNGNFNIINKIDFLLKIINS